MAPPVDPLAVALADVVRRVLREELAGLVADLRPAANATAPALLDKRALARELSLSVKSIDRLVAAGLPFVVLGSVKRFELGAVRAWIASRNGAFPVRSAVSR